MKGFLGKIFGGSKESTKGTPGDLVADVLDAVIERSGLNLSFDLEETDRGIEVEMYGEDEEMLTDKDGQLLDAIQLYLKRVVQHQVPGEKLELVLDCDGFRQQANQSLIDLAEKLKGIAMEKGKPVYFRALPPRDRKVIHQYLAEEGSVKSRSIGDGLYKKIKIYPAKKDNNKGNTEATAQGNV